MCNFVKRPLWQSLLTALLFSVSFPLQAKDYSKPKNPKMYYFLSGLTNDSVYKAMYKSSLFGNYRQGAFPLKHSYSDPVILAAREINGLSYIANKPELSADNKLWFWDGSAGSGGIISSLFIDKEDNSFFIDPSDASMLQDLDIGGSLVVHGDFEPGEMVGDLLPKTATQNIGSLTQPWQSIYVEAGHYGGGFGDADGGVSITGTGGISMDGQLTIKGGTPGAGKILTSDANGLATWEDVPGSSGNTLDQAYDQGGSGDGRFIIADAGPFEVSGVDGAVFTGEFNSGGLIPASGAGVRMMWYPKKAAFRVGYIDGTQWDETNIGNGSTATGINTTASGNVSTAMGSSTTASGESSTAMGNGTVASGISSTAMGVGTTAEGDYSTAMGWSTIANKVSSTAMGFETTASGDVSTATGMNTTASGEGSTAMGVGCTASGIVSTAIGEYSTAEGDYSTTMGFETFASANYSTAMGNGTTASGIVSTAMGALTTASGDVSTAMGSSTTASGSSSIAMGSQTEASGDASTAMGISSTASGNYSSAMGFSTTAIGESSTAMGSSTTANGASSTALGVQTEASGSGSTATGMTTTASGIVSTAMGGYTTAEGDYSTTMGFETYASKNSSTAMGNGTTASGIVSTAMGGLTTASGDASTSMGSSTVASGESSTAMGLSTTASGNYSTAMGNNTEASGSYSASMGVFTTASGEASTAMGFSTTASGNYSSAMGSYASAASFAGAFVIGDHSSTTNVVAAKDNQMVMRFSGGFKFYTNASMDAGAIMNSGDNSWSSISDSTKKENFAFVDKEYFLNSLSELKLVSWNYKGQKPEKHRHYGPMAQEIFHYFGKDEFGIIGNDTTLASADMDGIMMICLQALENRTSELKSQNEELKTQNSEMRKRLDELEKIVSAYIKNDNNSVTAAK